MEITLEHFSLFLYHAGVVVSGAAIVSMLGFTTQGSILAVSGVFALVWTVYYNYAMRERFEGGDAAPTEVE